MCGPAVDELLEAVAVPACDLQHTKIRSVMVCPVATIDESLESVDRGNHKSFKDNLAKGKPHARLPDVSLNQIMVAANHIEGLTRGRSLNKNRDSQTTPTGGSVGGVLSFNTGRPYDPEDVRLADEVIRQVEAEEESRAPTVRHRVPGEREH